MLEFLFIKFVGLQAYNFIKKRLQHRSFPVKFDKFLRTPILKNICGPLFLLIVDYCCCKKIVNKDLFILRRQKGVNKHH